MGFFSSVAKSIGGAVGGLVGGVASSLLGHRNSTAQQQRNISWEKEQLQNRHQWEVADLKAAGLNPILSANSAAGGAASAPGSGSSEVDIARSMKEMALLDAQIDNLNASSAQSLQQARLTGEQANTQPFVRKQIESGIGLNSFQAKTQQQLARMYGAQASNFLINSAVTQRDYDFLNRNPQLYAGQQAAKLGNSIPGTGVFYGQALRRFIDSFTSHSAGSHDSGLKGNFSNFGEQYYGY